MAPDRHDFAEVVLPHLDAAFNLARWLMRNADEAEDVVQEAMLRALSYFSGYHGGNARAWLLQIVRNTAFASMRLNRGVAIVPLDDGEEGVTIADPGADPEAAAIKGEARQTVDELLSRLPVELREALVLREIEELPYKDIADITAVPIGTVMSRLWRARRLLANAVADERRDEERAV